MLIFCCGMIRSGSTLQYQIASGVARLAGAGEGAGWDWDKVRPEMASADRPVFVVKVHTPNPAIESSLDLRNVRYVYSHRDVRDAMASYIQKDGPVTDERFEELLLEQLASYEHFTTRRGAHVAPYEALTRDIPGEARAIERLMGVTIGDQARADLCAGLRLDRQRERIASRPWRPGEQWDEETLLHHNHIRDGASGKWREVLTPAQRDIVRRVAGDWLRARGGLSQRSGSPGAALS